MSRVRIDELQSLAETLSKLSGMKHECWPVGSGFWCLVRIMKNGVPDQLANKKIGDLYWWMDAYRRGYQNGKEDRRKRKPATA